MLNINTYNIIGIDPGNNLGISIFTIDPIDNYKILNIDTTTYVLSKHLKDEDTKIDKYILLSNFIQYLLKIYNPVAIGLEAAFMNSKFANAVIQLTQYVNIIEYTIYNINPFINMLKYPPKLIKSTVSKGDANKEDMLESILKIKDITNCIDPILLTEHEIDATAIAYTLLQDIKNYQLLLLSQHI